MKAELQCQVGGRQYCSLSAAVEERNVAADNGRLSRLADGMVKIVPP
jgi:hypothetical protein